MAGDDSRFSITLDVPAPPARVFEVMADVERWHEWTPSVTSLKRLDAGPFLIGSRAVIKQPKFPQALWTVTSIEKGRSFTWENRAPGIRVIARHSVEATASGSRVTLSLRYQGLLARILAHLTRNITNRYLKMEADGLSARAQNPAFRY